MQDCGASSPSSRSMELLLSRQSPNMSTEILQSSLHCLISKLAHPLEAVRVTALESLHFSVSEGRVNPSKSFPGDIDLLLRSLLEWFNLPDYTHGKEVLDLLVKLAKDEFMRDYLLELGCVEFMQQLRAYCASDMWNSIDALLYILCSVVQNQKSSASPTLDFSESKTPTSIVVEIKSTSSLLRSESPVLAHRPETPASPPKTVDEDDFGFDPNDPLNLPSVNLEPSEKKYLFDLSVRLKCLANQQCLEEALKELKEVVVDFYPELVLQELKFPEILISLIQELPNTRVEGVAYDILHVLVKQLKGTVVLHKESCFRPLSEPKECLADKSNNSSVTCSYPSNPRQLLEDGLASSRCVISLGRILYILTLQLITLLAEPNHHVLTLSVLQTLIPLLQPARLTDEVRLHFSRYFQTINNVLQTFRERAQHVEGSFSRDIATAHCLPVLSIVCLTGNLMSLLEPSSVSGLLPAELISSLTIVAGDPVLAECTMSFQQTVVPFLPYLDAQFIKSYYHSNIAFSLRNGFHDALTSAEAVVKDGSVSDMTVLTSCLDKMLQIVPYISYCGKERLIERYTKVVLGLVHDLHGRRQVDESADISNVAGDLLLSLMSNSSRTVREVTYQCLVRACRTQTVRGASAETEASSHVFHRWILRSKSVLAHVLTCGLQELTSSKQAAELMADLLEGLSSDTQKRLLPVLPWIACSGNTPGMELFAQKVVGLVMGDDRTEVEAPARKVWMGLALMLMPLYSKDAWERSQAGKRLLEALQTKDQGSLWLSYRATHKESSVKNPAAAYCKDPFQHCLLRTEEFNTERSRPTTLDFQTDEISESVFFKKRTMEDLLSIFRNTENVSMVRKSAVQQLIRLLEDSPMLPPFAKVDELIDDLIAEILTWIKSRPTAKGDYPEGYELDDFDKESKTCLGLLIRLTIIPAAEGACSVHELLLNDPEKLIQPLLPLVFHPSPDVRTDIAVLLSFLLFGSNVLYSGLKELEVLDQQLLAKEELYYWETTDVPTNTSLMSFFVPVPFFKWYIFPCKAVPVKMCNFQEAFQYSLDESLIRFRVSQLEIIQDGAEKAFQSLSDRRRSDMASLSVSELQILTTLESLCPKLLVKAALKQLRTSKTHEEDLRILSDLWRLLPHGPKTGELLAREEWIEAFHRFLLPPKSAKAVTLLLKVLRIVELSLLTTANDEGLLFLGEISKTTLVPIISECVSLFGAQSVIVIDAEEVEHALLHFLVNLLETSASRSGISKRISHMVSKGTALLPALRFQFNRKSRYLCSVLAVQCISWIAKSMSETFSITDEQSEAYTEGSPSKPESEDVCGELVEAIIPFIMFLARFSSKNRVTLRHKQLVREVLYCLWCITSSVAPSLWEQVWASAGATFWLSKLANDQEARVRGMAFALIALLASDTTQMTRYWLKQNWPEFHEIMVQTSLNNLECYAVRQECLRFILANLGAGSSFHEHYCLYPEIQETLERNLFWEKVPSLLIEEGAVISFRAIVIQIILKAAVSGKYIRQKALCGRRFFEALMEQFSVLKLDERDPEPDTHTSSLVVHAVELLAYLAQIRDQHLESLIYHPDTILKLFEIFCYFSGDEKANLSSHAANAIYSIATALNMITFELLPNGSNDQGEVDSVIVNDFGAPQKISDELLKKRLVFNDLIGSHGERLFKAAMIVLKKLPRLKIRTGDSTTRSSSWRIRMSMCALMCTLLSEGKDALLAETEQGGADDKLISDVCESLFLELEDTYAFSTSASEAHFSHYEILPALLAVGTALQNLLAYSSKAKKATLRIYGPRRLITIAYEARSQMFDKGSGTLLTCQQLNLSSYNHCSQSLPMLELHTGVFPDGSDSLKRRIPDGPVEFLPKSLKFLLQRMLLLALRLMKNLTYNCPEAAESCIEFGSLELVRSLWRSNVNQDESLLHEMLGFLCNLAAQSDNAKDIITNDDGQSGKVDLMTQVCSLITQLTLDKSSYLLAVGLLQSLMTRCETRAVFLRKKQLPVILAQLSNAVRAKDLGRQHLLLQLLVNISGHPYGQHMVLKDLSHQPHFDLVLDIIERGLYPAKAALFLLRNLAFSRESRPFFLLNSRTIMLLANCTQADNIEKRAYAASAIWVLIANGHKIAKALRRAGSLPLLGAAEVKTKLELQSSPDRNELLVHAYQCLVSINQLAGAFQQPILNYKSEKYFAAVEPSNYETVRT